MRKEKSSRPLAGGAGAKGTDLKRVGPKLRAKRPTRKAEFFLHVRPDGTERRYRHEPTDCPSLFVFVRGGAEITFTRRRRVWFEMKFYDNAFSPPPGAGWRLIDYDAVSATWERAVRR